jgi:hypothetical protein
MWLQSGLTIGIRQKISPLPVGKIKTFLIKAKLRLLLAALL